jgi:hypothetical protein
LLAGLQRGCEPFRLQATAGPGLAAGRVAVLGGDLAAAGAGARARGLGDEVGGSQTMLGHQCTNLGNSLVALLAARVRNLAVDFGLLGQQFLQGRHVSNPRVNSTIETSYRAIRKKKLQREAARDTLHMSGGLDVNIHRRGQKIFPTSEVKAFAG